MTAPERLSVPAARRIALAAQGLDRGRPSGRIDRRHLRRVLGRIGVVQIDSVNVVARSHELPLYARLGTHPRNMLVDASHRREVFEYWGHEASFIPVEQQPLFRHKMAAAESGRAWGSLVRLARDRPALIEQVYAEVAERGPLRVAELSDGGGRRGPWWGWSDTKQALEWLFWCGRLGARRRPSFEREYGLPHHFVPAEILALPTPPEDEQRRRLLVSAARSLGVATAGDLADYYRLNLPRARPLLEELVEDGQLLRAEVEGWRGPCYLDPGARLPRRATGRALLSPFDSLVWERDRTQRLFGFHYRIELYTPAAKRRFGYYVMPFLLGDALVARVDLKADRDGKRLLVLAAYVEPAPGAPAPMIVAAALAAELRALAHFLALSDVAVAGRGDLSGDLTTALASGD